jgi:hypothetical protein
VNVVLCLFCVLLSGEKKEKGGGGRLEDSSGASARISGRIFNNVSTPERFRSREQDDFSGTLGYGGMLKTLWAAGKMFGYRHKDFLSLKM